MGFLEVYHQSENYSVTDVLFYFNSLSSLLILKTANIGKNNRKYDLTYLHQAPELFNMHAFK